MAGYQTVLFIHDLEKRCDQLGLMMCFPSHRPSTDLVAIKPKDDSLPIYSRDAELFHGTLSELQVFISGIEWSRKYDKMLFGIRHDEKRLRKEQDYRNELLVKELTK